MNASEYEQFYKKLGDVLSISPAEAETFINGYSTGDLAFFQGYFGRLPLAKIAFDDKKTEGVETLFIKGNNIGSGTYGQVAKNRFGPFAYKVPNGPEDPEYASPATVLNYAKGIFKEIIIQALLQSDSEYGKYICHIFKVFRQGPLNVIIKMDQLDKTIQYAYNNRHPAAKPMDLKSEELKQILIKLFQILIHFRNKYGFQHLDLHVGNVMTKDHGDRVADMKLIDFGKSAIAINNLTIPGDPEDEPDGFMITNSIRSDIKHASNPYSPSFSKMLDTMIALPKSTSLEEYLAILSETNLNASKPRRTRRSKLRKNTKRRRRYGSK